MMQDKQLKLDEEELQLIGEHRYKKDHTGKNSILITLGCYVLAAVLGYSLYRMFPGTYLYAFGLFPAVIPLYLNMRLSNRAAKAGEEFAKKVLGS